LLWKPYQTLLHRSQLLYGSFWNGGIFPGDFCQGDYYRVISVISVYSHKNITVLLPFRAFTGYGLPLRLILHILGIFYLSANGGGQMILWPPPFSQWGRPWPLGLPLCAPVAMVCAPSVCENTCRIVPTHTGSYQSTRNQ